MFFFVFDTLINIAVLIFGDVMRQFVYKSVLGAGYYESEVHSESNVPQNVIKGRVHSNLIATCLIY